MVALYNESRELFAPIGFKVDSLVMDRRGSWSRALSNGTQVVIGRTDARPRLGRFARMLPQLLARNALPLQRADLRYTNGFALSWGEQGIGNGESGIGRANPGSLVSAASIGRIPNSEYPAFPIPHSPFPIPGLTT